MKWGNSTALSRLFAALIAALSCFFVVHSASAAQPCHAGFDTLQAFEAAAAREQRICGELPAIGPGRVDSIDFVVPDSGLPPDRLYTRLGAFQRALIIVEDVRGARTRRGYRPADAVPSTTGPRFTLPLPATQARPRRVIIAFERAGYLPMLSEARLVAGDPAAAPQERRNLLLLATLFGMMLIPLAFNIGFWRILRQPFVLWHAALSVSFAVLVAVRSGLVHEWWPLDIVTWRVALVMSFGAAIAIAAMFTRSFVEPGRMHPALRRLLPLSALWVIAISAVYAASFPVLRPFGGSIHTLALLPVLILFAAVMGDAFRNGSRAVRFQLIGWSPLVLSFALQIVRSVAPLDVPDDGLAIFYFGLLCETVATAMGVADRFMIIKHERDQAETRAQLLESLSQSDPLTGLMNRRAIEPRFVRLRESGFDTLAVVDLDMFKAINDDFGHAKGDEVLRIVGEALAPDDDTLAARLGGEEFLLFLRGPDARQRAEARRVAITQRVARECSGMDRLITASMGLVELPRDATRTEGFVELYAQADRLLYEAKATGRNRTVAERLQYFGVRGEGLQPEAA